MKQESTEGKPKFNSFTDVIWLKELTSGELSSRSDWFPNTFIVFSPFQSPFSSDSRVFGIIIKLFCLKPDLFKTKASEKNVEKLARKEKKNWQK